MSREISGESMSWFDVIKNASSIMMKWLQHDKLRPIVEAFPGKNGLIRDMFIKMIEDMQYKYRSGEEPLAGKLEEGNMIGEYYLEPQEFNNPYFRFQIGPKKWGGETNRYDDYDRLHMYHIYFKEYRDRHGEDWDNLINMLLGTGAMGGA